MYPSIAGARTTRLRVARSIQVSKSSASPLAALAMTLAVAGATTIASQFSANATCSIPASEAGSKSWCSTGLCVRLRNVSGATKFIAPSLITTSTNAPCWTSLLVRSAAL